MKAAAVGGYFGCLDGRRGDPNGGLATVLGTLKSKRRFGGTLCGQPTGRGGDCRGLVGRKPRRRCW